MKTKILALFATVMLFASGCSAMGPKEGTGTLLGAGAGALVGSQFGGGKGRLVSVALGTLGGALIGQEVGRSLDRADRLAMEQTAQESLEFNPSHHASEWVNPDSGNSGTITPTRTYETAAGQPCREYVQTVHIGGRDEKMYGHACRQADGSWQLRP